MNIRISQSINIRGCGMPMLPMGRPHCGFGMSIFPGFFAQTPIMNNYMAAGFCTGLLLGTPGVLGGIAKAGKWTYNHILKPVGSFMWNSVIKPVGNFLYSNVLKPIGSGIKYVWDHTLGRLFRKSKPEVEEKTAKKPEETETET